MSVNIRKAASLTQDQMVAILLLSIDQELSAQVLRKLHDDNVDRVTRAMKELQEIAIDSNAISVVYEEAMRRLREGGLALGDVSQAMDRVLVKAFGESRGQDVSQRANTEILAKRPFAMFESLTAEDLANLLIEEHPQIGAVFLAHLDRSKAGKVLACLPEDRRPDLLHRVATLDRTPPEVVQRVLDVMRKKVKDLGLTTLRSEPKAWIKAAAQILNNMGGGEKLILEQIAEQDEGISGHIREEMFTFEDLPKLDKKAMQKILSQVDTRALAVSLKAAPGETERAILSNLSKRAAEMVVEERDSLGPMPLSEVVEAQQQVMVIVQDLMDRGEITAVAAKEQLV